MRRFVSKMIPQPININSELVQFSIGPSDGRIVTENGGFVGLILLYGWFGGRMIRVSQEPQVQASTFWEPLVRYPW